MAPHSSTRFQAHGIRIPVAQLSNVKSQHSIRGRMITERLSTMNWTKTGTASINRETMPNG